MIYIVHSSPTYLTKLKRKHVDLVFLYEIFIYINCANYEGRFPGASEKKASKRRNLKYFSVLFDKVHLASVEYKHISHIIVTVI